MLNSLSLLVSVFIRFFFNHSVQVRERTAGNSVDACAGPAIQICSATWTQPLAPRIANGITRESQYNSFPSFIGQV